jgi:hypothetical protein
MMSDDNTFTTTAAIEWDASPDVVAAIRKSNPIVFVGGHPRSRDFRMPNTDNARLVASIAVAAGPLGDGESITIDGPAISIEDS